MKEFKEFVLDGEMPVCRLCDFFDKSDVQHGLCCFKPRTRQKNNDSFCSKWQYTGRVAFALNDDFVPPLKPNEKQIRVRQISLNKQIFRNKIKYQ